ncbi:hypothetical protein KSW81_004025 [Nannochloris sp. 'desiccata']|nr:hypothetical protein KSW81_004025 [Chlorella desiccata (nom. nud.)]
MTPERIAILKSMSWKIWDAQEGAWQSRFEELVKHVDKFGEHPPQSHPTLGKWVQNQRTAYQAWKARLNNGTEKCEDVSHSMDEERIRKLESVPQWSWKPVADTWEANYQVLFTYAHKHKKLPPVSHLKLWIWIDSQRLAYRAWQACLKGESDKYSNVIHYMDEERVRKLELVPYWKWSMRS